MTFIIFIMLNEQLHRSVKVTWQHLYVKTNGSYRNLNQNGTPASRGIPSYISFYFMDKAQIKTEIKV